MYYLLAFVFLSGMGNNWQAGRVEDDTGEQRIVFILGFPPQKSATGSTSLISPSVPKVHTIHLTLLITIKKKESL